MQGVGWPVRATRHEKSGDGLEAARFISESELVLRVAPLVAVPTKQAAASRCAICMRNLLSSGHDPARRNDEVVTDGVSCDKCGVATLCSGCAKPGGRGSVLHEDECSAWKSLDSGTDIAGRTSR